MIELDGIRHHLLAIPRLALDEGTIAVIGANGSGKTTLLELCAGIEVPQRGSVRIDESEPRSCEVGWVCEFPDKNLLFERVRDEIASPLRFTFVDEAGIADRVARICDRLAISPLLERRTPDLSGGEKALVALATALIVHPRVLVIDEADSHLDAAAAQRMYECAREVRPPYLLFCTQDMHRAAEADRVLFLADGRVGAYGTPDDVFFALQETCFYPPLWRLARCA
ncbi:MAG: energy-coupling factor ABC transporter ATP-binding protein [Methanomicrobiaceae archaeon]|nr:energy-coupling factor ABC transporter ATP-binding protein [Methanomicrobiaceae archaeon]